MLKKIAIPSILLAVMLLLISAPQANAKVRFGVYVGPSYTYAPYPYVYSYPYGYYYPPVVRYYRPPTYVYPYRHHHHRYYYNGYWR